MKLTEIGLDPRIKDAPDDVRRLALHRDQPLPFAVADLAARDAPAHMAFRAVTAKEVAGADGVLDLGIAVLNDTLDGVCASQRVGRVGGQRATILECIWTEDTTWWRRERVGQHSTALQSVRTWSTAKKDKIAHRFNFVQERMLYQALVKQQRVVVHHIDKLWARRGA